MRSTTLSKSLGVAVLLAASSSCFAQAASAATPHAATSIAMPQPAAVVQGQGAYALAQLRGFAAIYGADPSGKASREAMQNGWAPVNRSYASAQGWPARGPTLGESIEPLLAQARAAQSRCAEYEGPCQDQAASWAKSEASRIAKAKNPGAELSRSVAGFGDPR